MIDLDNKSCVYSVNCIIIHTSCYIASGGGWLAEISYPAHRVLIICTK